MDVSFLAVLPHTRRPGFAHAALVVMIGIDCSSWVRSRAAAGNITAAAPRQLVSVSFRVTRQSRFCIWYNPGSFVYFVIFYDNCGDSVYL